MFTIVLVFFSKLLRRKEEGERESLHLYLHIMYKFCQIIANLLEQITALNVRTIADDTFTHIYVCVYICMYIIHTH